MYVGHSIYIKLNKVKMTTFAKFKFFYMLISKLNLFIKIKARLVKNRRMYILILQIILKSPSSLRFAKNT